MVENLLNGQLVGADGRLTWQQLEAEHKKKKFRNLGGETASLQVATVAQPVAISTSEVDSLRQLIEKMGEQMEADSNELRQQMKEESNKRQKVEKELESVKTEMHQIWGGSTFGKDRERCKFDRGCPAAMAMAAQVDFEMKQWVEKHNQRIREQRKGKQKAMIEKPIQKKESAIAFLDPNYRVPQTNMPFCFPTATRIFFAAVVQPLDHGTVTRTVALQLEPHGRMLIVGKESHNLSVRLDNIMYHPIMPFNKSPFTCDPCCFPTGKLEGKGMNIAGCVKCCTPSQYVKQKNGDLILSPCKCAMLKRLGCFKHANNHQTKQASIACGQFKRLMSTSDPSKCDQICAGQLAAF